MSTAYDQAEATKVRAHLDFRNACVYAQDIANRLGVHSPEFGVARGVVLETRARLVRAYDALISLSRGDGVPVERER